DMYLDEIQEQLEVQQGAIVSAASIWKALKRTGYSMKKVHLGNHCECLLYHFTYLLAYMTCPGMQ
ncbi:hypothetical protein L208DRAFT_1280492, partial [Tricholoma matsutake]